MRAGLPVAAFGCVLALTACSPTPAVDTPWPQPPSDRPVVDLAFTVADSLRQVSGTERVTFTPDQQICELVFRAWPNKPATAESGNSLTVNTISVGGRPLPVEVTAAGAPTTNPGTLLTARLPACSPSGRPVTADITFALTLGPDTDERIGYSPTGRVAWFGTAFPVLAWQRGRGWVRDPAVPVVGEMTTSEIFRLQSLTVTAAHTYAVAGVGQEVSATPQPSSTKQSGSDSTAAAAVEPRITHRFRADAVRDVSVTVGELDITTAKVGATSLRLALPSRGSRGDAEEWTAALSAAVPQLEARFGPNPFPDLWVSVIPGTTDGVEFTGALQFGDVNPTEKRWLVLHELAHQWFYGLVGNNQARHPWMDEAFATYAQQLIDPVQKLGPALTDGQMGKSMEWFAGRSDAEDSYVATIYQGGAATLLAARRAAGGEAFDSAIRRYLHAQAWRVAAPGDLAAALHDLPAALEVLRKAGAIPAAQSS